MIGQGPAWCDELVDAALAVNGRRLRGDRAGLGLHPCFALNMTEQEWRGLMMVDTLVPQGFGTVLCRRRPSSAATSSIHTS